MKIENKKGDGIAVPGLPGLDNNVFYTVGNKQYVRTYVKPRNPRTRKQRGQRKKFGELVKRWQALSDDEKEEYNQRARRMKMSGFNLFMSENAKDARE